MIGPNLSEWSLKRPSFIVFLMILAVVAGALAFKKLGRDEDPSFTVRTMIVAAAWPGATVEETIEQVTERLERTLQETHTFDAVRSYTIAGQTTIFVDLDETTATADIPDVWYRVRRNIADMRGTLPAGVLGPFFNDDFGDTFGIIYGFTADGFTFRQLRDHVEDIRSKLLQVPDVAKIEVLGAQDERIYIEFSNEKLAGLRLNQQAIIGTLQAQNLLRPSGVLNTDKERVYLRVSGAFDNERDIENVNLVMGDRVVRLGDIAEVKRGFVDPPTPMFRVNGKPAIGLAISMRDQADILALGRNVRAEMDRIRAELPVGIEPVLVADQSATVDFAINDFLVSLYQAIAIILVCSFVSLGVRPGLVVAIAIPITMALVFTVMNALHIDLQRVSLGALIIALTLLVDDAMTTVDATQRRLAAGDPPDAAASFAYRTLAAPMLIGTLVTIASFVPVGFAPGGASEVLQSLFSVVAIALIASWLVAVVFGPIICKALLKPPAPTEGEPKPSKLKDGYQAFLRGAIRARWLTIGVTVAMFAAAMLALPLVPRQFFPSSDRNELLVDLTLRQNASIAASERTAERVEALLNGDPDVDHYSTYVGRGAIRFYLPLSVHLANPFFSQIVVVAKSIEARDRLQARLEGKLAVDFPELVSRVSPLEMGPPVGWPLQYRVIGPDKDELRRIAEKVGTLMAADTRVRNVNYDWMEPARQLRLHIDQDEARRLGISTAGIAAVLQASVTGTTITQVRDDIYLVNVVARATDSERASFDTLASLQVATPSGRMVPMSQFARFSEEQEFPLVWRRDRVPTLTVQADVTKGVLPESVVAAIGPSIAKYNATLPRGYKIETGGLYESSNDSSENVFSVVPMMILLMLLFMMMLLISFRRLAMVVFILPLGLIGVVGALLLFQRPLGFVAILGILALIGMIAKNAVILIVSIEEEREAGASVTDAVMTAAGNRLTPLVLTAISTVLGLIPIAPTIFWGPMAIAIMGGLMVASLLTLILLPVLYITIFGRDDKKSPPPQAVAKPA
ncbi:MAG TPA: efflux RND transporter permease subunit [Burkholderiaceae bacterium]|nr:efflux RND transporter permease subunit [Burkholderiaceae bacterium]